MFETIEVQESDPFFRREKAINVPRSKGEKLPTQPVYENRPIIPSRAEVPNLWYAYPRRLGVTS
ncbi:hypothetical protein AVEN_269566-1, partial [Araneus ventricosus]